jgi:hypothetical protein
MRIHGTKRLILLLAFLSSVTPLLAAEPIIYSVDFSTQKPGPAASWLKQHGFESKLGFESLHPTFGNGALELSTDRPGAGLCVHDFPKGKALKGVKKLRIVWGVNQFPEGADWERGIDRLAIGLIVSFGYEQLPSGLPFGIHPEPYFICPFIGSKEIEGKAYAGKYFKQGGRYLCVKSRKPGAPLVTELNLDHLFKSLFNKTETPPVSAFGIQMNTKDTKGKASAFIKTIEFLDGE